MKTYLIDGSTISAFSDSPKSKPKTALLVRSAKDFDAKRFPLKRVNELLATLSPQANGKPAANRAAAVNRLWTAIEQIPCPQANSSSKLGQMIALVQRAEGASLEELAQVTGWQRHSIRGALSGHLRKKLGLNLTRVKDGDRIAYQISMDGSLGEISKKRPSKASNAEKPSGSRTPRGLS